MVDDSSYTWEGWVWEDNGLQDTPENRENKPGGFRYTCAATRLRAHEVVHMAKHQLLEDKALAEKRRQRKRLVSKISKE